MKKYAFVLFLFYAPINYAQITAFEIKTLSKEDILLTENVEVFEDSTRQLTILQVSSTEFEKRFHKNLLPAKKNGEDQSGVVWGRFRIKNSTGGDLERYLTGNWTHATLFRETNPETFDQQYSGSCVPMNEKKLKLPFAIYELSIKSGEESQFYFCYQNDNYYKFNTIQDIRIRTRETYYQDHQKSYFNFFAFAGIEFMMIIYAIALFIVFRNKTYLWLCLALASNILYFLNNTGLDQYIFTSNPLFSLFVKEGRQLLFIPLMLIAQIHFLSSFLEFKKHFKRLQRTVVFLFYSNALCTPLFILFGHSISGINYSNILILVSVTFLGYLILKLSLKGNPLAKVMLYSQGLLILSIILTQLIVLGVIQTTTIAGPFVLMIGYFLQSLFWTFGIIYKLVILRNDKEKAQFDMIHALQSNEKLMMEQNSMLELKVDERTRELVEKNILGEKQKVEAEQLREKAIKSEQFKQQFLANMSHEIRTPMNAVIGMTNLVLDSPLQPKQKFYLEGIKKSGDNLLHIINDILDLSKVEAGKIELEEIDFSVSEVIEQVKQTLQHKAEEKGLQLITQIDDSVPDALIGDPARINQVLINIAGNAIKFTERGSVVIEVAPGTQQHGFRFSVIDTGIGIPKDKINSVFESFSQANASDTRKYGGTGLGLTISRQFVELMGGIITVESEVNSGTSFFFEILLPTGSYARMLQQKSLELTDGSVLNGLHILLAEDNDYNRIVVIDTLKSKAQIEIDVAVNGLEAIELFKLNEYDIVLMDVQMPEVNGYEATQKIRTEFSSPKNQIPIIALTASVIRSDIDKCRQAGMNSYVPKPFSPLQLISAIAEATGRKVNPLSTSPSNHITVANKLPAVDLTYLKNFCEDDTQKIKKYINMFLDALPPVHQKLEKAIAENDIDEIATQVHAFRPKLMMMGMKDAQESAHKIEKLCLEESNTGEVMKNLILFREQIENAMIALKSV